MIEFGEDILAVAAIPLTLLGQNAVSLYKCLTVPSPSMEPTF